VVHVLDGADVLAALGIVLTLQGSNPKLKPLIL
jgi:hypothetical protein